MERLFIECAVRAALIALITAVVLRTIGIRPAAARHTAWTSVMLTMLLLPIWTAWGPKTPIRLLPPVHWQIPVQLRNIERQGNIRRPPQNVLPDSIRVKEMRTVETSVPPPASQNWIGQYFLPIVYGLGALLLLARLAIGTARTHRLRRRANVRDGKGISTECTCPITVGWLHPVVILPGNWREWSPRQLEAVLTHEREHVRRRDPLIQWLALVNRALFWFHPLSWWLERNLSGLAEEACDAAVLASGHTPQDYSEYLLDIAGSVSRSGFRLGIVGMAMPGSLLRQRIGQILNSGGAPPISRKRIALAVAACAASSALLASGTLDHARAATDKAHVQPSASYTAYSSASQTAGAKPEIAPPAAYAPETPKVRKSGGLLAQATTPIAPAPQMAVTASPDSAEQEKQLQAALLRSDPITTMPIAMEINYFRLNNAEYSVPVTVKIPGGELGLARNRGAERASFDFLGQVKDDLGVAVQNVREKVSVNLNGAAAAQLASTPFEYDTEFRLLPGRYSMKLLARNNETGRIGTYQTAFTVPNLNKEEQRVPISSVVLSSQRVEMANPINPASPLVAEGRKLIPSVTRVFSKGREMYVYLQAYQREAGNTQPLFAFATFYQGHTKALETAPIEVTQGMDPKSKAIPLSLSISLADLEPGEYTCQVTVWSPIAQKTALWQAPIVIEP